MQVVRDLETLVGFPTVSNRPLTALTAWLAQRCEDRGLDVERFVDPADAEKCSLICSVGPKDPDGLVISGHMDVVPTEGQPWSTDPFRVTEKDGKLYGRGTADMKGFFAATLQALARIEAREFTRELTLIWTHDEEIGCLGSRQLADAWADVGRPLPSACLIGEPTSFQILRMHPGHVAMEITVFGKAAHSSRPDLGANAIEAATKVVAMVQTVAAQLQSEAVTHLPELERPWVAVNVARITGGSAINIVPDACTIQIGYRPLPGMDAQQIFARIRDRLADLKLPRGAKATLIRVSPAMLTPAHTPLEGLLRPHSPHEGCGAASFATDGGNLARLGLEPLVFGPGSIEVAHKADEFIPTAGLIRAVDVIEDVIRRRCCGGT